MKVSNREQSRSLVQQMLVTPRAASFETVVLEADGVAARGNGSMQVPQSALEMETPPQLRLAQGRTHRSNINFTALDCVPFGVSISCFETSQQPAKTDVPQSIGESSARAALLVHKVASCSAHNAVQIVQALSCSISEGTLETALGTLEVLSASNTRLGQLAGRGRHSTATVAAAMWTGSRRGSAFLRAHMERSNTPPGLDPCRGGITGALEALLLSSNQRMSDLEAQLWAANVAAQEDSTAHSNPWAYAIELAEARAATQQAEADSLRVQLASSEACVLRAREAEQNAKAARNTLHEQYYQLLQELPEQSTANTNECSSPRGRSRGESLVSLSLSECAEDANDTVTVHPDCVDTQVPPAAFESAEGVSDGLPPPPASLAGEAVHPPPSTKPTGGSSWFGKIGNVMQKVHKAVQPNGADSTPARAAAGRKPDTGSTQRQQLHMLQTHQEYFYTQWTLERQETQGLKAALAESRQREAELIQQAALLRQHMGETTEYGRAMGAELTAALQFREQARSRIDTLLLRGQQLSANLRSVTAERNALHKQLGSLEGKLKLVLEDAQPWSDDGPMSPASAASGPSSHLLDLAKQAIRAVRTMRGSLAAQRSEEEQPVDGADEHRVAQLQHELNFALQRVEVAEEDMATANHRALAAEEKVAQLQVQLQLQAAGTPNGSFLVHSDTSPAGTHMLSPEGSQEWAPSQDAVSCITSSQGEHPDSDAGHSVENAPAPSNRRFIPHTQVNTRSVRCLRELPISHPMRLMHARDILQRQQQEHAAASCCGTPRTRQQRRADVLARANAALQTPCGAPHSPQAHRARRHATGGSALRACDVPTPAVRLALALAGGGGLIDGPGSANLQWARSAMRQHRRMGSGVPSLDGSFIAPTPSSLPSACSAARPPVHGAVATLFSPTGIFSPPAAARRAARGAGASAAGAPGARRRLDMLAQ